MSLIRIRNVTNASKEKRELATVNSPTQSHLHSQVFITVTSMKTILLIILNLTFLQY